MLRLDHRPGVAGQQARDPGSHDRGGLDRRRQLAQNQLVQLHALAGLVDVDANEAPGGVVVQHHALGNLAALDARLVRKVDVERVGVGEVTEFHGLNPRPGKAFRIVTLSAKVITRKQAHDSFSLRGMTTF